MMLRRKFSFIFALGVSFFTFALQVRGETAAVASEILKANCSGCHSAQTKASDFSVATLDAVIAGGKKHGRSVVGGHPEKSTLIKIIKGEISPRMPMGKSLADADVAKLEAWIRNLPQDKAVSAKQVWRWPYEKPVKQSPRQ
ncbi:MAG: cytochrome c [Bryobacteraceae bacterium]